MIIMKNLKVGILTYHFSDNYGAVFQAYATVNYLCSLGVEASIINYEPSYVDKGAGFCFPLSKHEFKKNIITFYQIGINNLDRLIGKDKIKSFKEFRTRHLKVDDKIYKEYADFSKSELDYDLIISGSDQIWNPGVNRAPDPVYYSLISSQARKITYAASYGTASPDFKDLNVVKEYLTQLDSISVREKSGVDIVKRISGLEATHVPDPTFLIRDYSKLIVRPSVKQSFIFSYILRSGKSVDKVVESVAEKLNCRIVRAKNYQRPWLNNSDCFEISPEEWISNIFFANFVVTNSFHGVALSINLNKNFIAIKLPGKKSSLNERVESLLETVGLKERIVDGSDIQAVEDILNSEIDWDSVNRKLDEFSSLGKNFLSDNLNKVTF